MEESLTKHTRTFDAHLSKTAAIVREVPIHFHQLDPGGILFFGNVFNIFHDVFEDFVKDVLELSWNTWFQNPIWCVPLRHVEADFKRPLIGGVSYLVSIYVQDVGESSFTLHSVFSNDDIDYCHVTSIHVFMDKSSNKKMAIPSIIRDKLNN